MDVLGLIIGMPLGNEAADQYKNFDLPYREKPAYST